MTQSQTDLAMETIKYCLAALKAAQETFQAIEQMDDQNRNVAMVAAGSMGVAIRIVGLAENELKREA